MKKILFSFSLLLIACTGMAQDWAPVGASWYYTEYFFGMFGVDYFRIQSVGDTLYEGKSCRKLIKRHNIVCSDRPSVEFMYNENNRVYFFDTIFNEFQVLYDFTPVVGNSWFIKLRNYGNPPDTDTLFVTVDSLEFVTINMNALQKFYVTYDFRNEMVPNYTYGGEILERIGDLSYMFNFQPSFGFVCDANMSGGLRCYDDGVIGHYETGIAASCDLVTVGIETPKEHSAAVITLYPDPGTDILHLRAESVEPAYYRITGLSGMILRDGAVCGGSIPVGTLPAGLYVLQLYDAANHQMAARKFMKE